MTDWPLKTVEELARPGYAALATGPFGSAIGSKTFRSEGVPVIRGGNLSTDVGIRIDDSDLVFIDETLATSFARSSVEAGDLVFTCWGTVNQVGIIDRTARFEKYIISNKQMKWSVDARQALPLFMYYYFSSVDGQAQITSRSIGSSVPGFNLTQLRSIPVPTPPLLEQQAIVEVLSSLDDKIELNRRTNATLEAMAQAIFLDLFVDFGPVRRKMEGATDSVAIMGGVTTDPARATELAELFPSTLEAEFPPGWQLDNFSAVATTRGETVAPASLDPKTAYIGLEHMPRRSIALGEWGPVEKVTSQKARFERGQVLFGKLRPYFHKVGIAPIDGVCSTDIVVLDGRSDFDREIVACCASSDAFVAFNDQASSGTKMPRTSWSIMQAFPIALAPEDVRRGFSRIVRPLHDKIIASITENRTLAETRDYLLPRLMSGEVRVREAEDLAEAAAA